MDELGGINSPNLVRRRRPFTNSVEANEITREI